MKLQKSWQTISTCATLGTGIGLFYGIQYPGFAPALCALMGYGAGLGLGASISFINHMIETLQQPQAPRLGVRLA